MIKDWPWQPGIIWNLQPDSRQRTTADLNDEQTSRQTQTQNDKTHIQRETHIQRQTQTYRQQTQTKDTNTKYNDKGQSKDYNTTHEDLKKRHMTSKISRPTSANHSSDIPKLLLLLTCFLSLLPLAHSRCITLPEESITEKGRKARMNFADMVDCNIMKISVPLQAQGSSAGMAPLRFKVYEYGTKPDETTTESPKTTLPRVTFTGGNTIITTLSPSPDKSTSVSQPENPKLTLTSTTVYADPTTTTQIQPDNPKPTDPSITIHSDPTTGNTLPDITTTQSSLDNPKPTDPSTTVDSDPTTGNKLPDITTAPSSPDNLKPTDPRITVNSDPTTSIKFPDITTTQSSPNNPKPTDPSITVDSDPTTNNNLPDITTTQSSLDNPKPTIPSTIVDSDPTTNNKLPDITTTQSSPDNPKPTDPSITEHSDPTTNNKLPDITTTQSSPPNPKPTDQSTTVDSDTATNNKLPDITTTQSLPDNPKPTDPSITIHSDPTTSIKLPDISTTQSSPDNPKTTDPSTTVDSDPTTSINLPDITTTQSSPDNPKPTVPSITVNVDPTTSNKLPDIVTTKSSPDNPKPSITVHIQYTYNPTLPDASTHSQPVNPKPTDIIELSDHTSNNQLPDKITTQSQPENSKSTVPSTTEHSDSTTNNQITEKITSQSTTDDPKPTDINIPSITVPSDAIKTTPNDEAGVNKPEENETSSTQATSFGAGLIHSATDQATVAPTTTKGSEEVTNAYEETTTTVKVSEEVPFELGPITLISIDPDFPETTTVETSEEDTTEQTTLVNDPEEASGGPGQRTSVNVPYEVSGAPAHTTTVKISEVSQAAGQTTIVKDSDAPGKTTTDKKSEEVSDAPGQRTTVNVPGEVSGASAQTTTVKFSEASDEAGQTTVMGSDAPGKTTTDKSLEDATSSSRHSTIVMVSEEVTDAPWQTTTDKTSEKASNPPGQTTKKVPVLEATVEGPNNDPLAIDEQDGTKTSIVITNGVEPTLPISGISSTKSHTTRISEESVSKDATLADELTTTIMDSVTILPEETSTIVNPTTKPFGLGTTKKNSNTVAPSKATSTLASGQETTVNDPVHTLANTGSVHGQETSDSMASMLTSEEVTSAGDHETTSKTLGKVTTIAGQDTTATESKPITTFLDPRTGSSVPPNEVTEGITHKQSTGPEELSTNQSSEGSEGNTDEESSSTIDIINMKVPEAGTTTEGQIDASEHMTTLKDSKTSTKDSALDIDKLTTGNTADGSDKMTTNDSKTPTIEIKITETNANTDSDKEGTTHNDMTKIMEETTYSKTTATPASGLVHTTSLAELNEESDMRTSKEPLSKNTEKHTKVSPFGTEIATSQKVEGFTSTKSGQSETTLPYVDTIENTKGSEGVDSQKLSTTKSSGGEIELPTAEIEINAKDLTPPPTTTPRPCTCPSTTTSAPSSSAPLTGTTTPSGGCLCPDIFGPGEVETATDLPTSSSAGRRRRRQDWDDMDLYVDDFDQKILKKMPFLKFY